MRVLVTGVTGYIGGRLVPRLLERGHEVRALVRDPRRVSGRAWARDVELTVGDLSDERTLVGIAAGVDAAYYLVHSMGAAGDFAERDRRAASNFALAAGDVAHTIYLGGLLPTGAARSMHLRSRAEVGEILRAALPTTEFRAGPIIGSGSASFEMVRYLTERLPAMIAPRWIRNQVQPIGVRDVLNYLSLALERAPAGIVEIGADRLTFRDMMLGYAAARGLRRVIVPVPVLAPTLASRWVGLVTPIPNALARPLIEGIVTPVVADTTRAASLFPEVVPMDYRTAVKLALERVDHRAVATRWTGALGDAPAYEMVDREGTMRETHTVHVDAPPEHVFATVCRLGGARGWVAYNWAWTLRGIFDPTVGGPGLRRGRRDPDALLPGEALDFWRVESVEPTRLLRLRAEMRVPGRAWLQFETIPQGTGTRLVQTAVFAPRGLWGALYWYGLYPIHRLIFRALVRGIAARAEAPDQASSAPRGAYSSSDSARSTSSSVL